MYELNENGEILIDNLTVFIPKEEINIQEFNNDIINFKRKRKIIYIISCIPFSVFFISSFLEIEKVVNISAILFGILVFMAIILTWSTIFYISKKYNCSTRNFKYSEKSNFRTNKNQ